VFLRPEQTSHVPNRRFWEKELFATMLRETYPTQLIAGVCYVMPVRDYFYTQPQGMSFDDVYFVMTKYYDRSASFAKIKDWKKVFHQLPLISAGDIVPRRKTPFIPARVHSALYTGPETKDDPTELEVIKQYLEQLVSRTFFLLLPRPLITRITTTLQARRLWKHLVCARCQ